ncbi:MAG: hypothetical protein IKV51_02350, partial [Clostridia bacterium]|nr:hypothetical protein [Clostridia bacterium]
TINKGNVPLYVVTYATFGDGLTELSVRCLHKPGESESLDAYGSNPATEHLTPGTQTEDLLGTVTVSFYAVGYDPDQYVHIEKTGPEVCRSETITRTWKVGKKTKWEIPEESQLTASLQVTPGYEHSDPAGYQLMEDYATMLYVKNTGGVDLDDFTVSDPWDGSVFSGGPIKVDEVKSFPRASGTVTEKNVEDGSIVFPLITVSWTDPDSEETRTTFAGPLTLPITSKTGLLVKKSVANKPAEGDYFKEDEVIKWGLTVTNNSKEPIKDVTVTDKGVTVGSYSEIAPGETKTCAVPDYTVTAYDADVVGYVLNSAAATGTDIKGVTRTYPSNTAKAWTSKPVTDIPTFDPEDHFDPDELPKGEDWCRLEPEAISENEAVYTLYTCAEHLETAQAAEMLALTGSFGEAAALWREEIDRLYEALAEAADETGEAILAADREAVHAYADAVTALFGDEEASELLRLRCAELCCMLHTAPEKLPWSLTGDWAEFDAFETYEASSREIGYLSGSENEVTERYAGGAARALADTRQLLDASSSYVRDEVFSRSINYWISALDDKVNPAYKAADKETRKLIAAWRKSLDSLYDAEEVFLKMLYPFDGETLNEQLMNLYKAAALMEKSY